MPSKKKQSKKKSDEAFEDTPRILSSEEKRELIRAHVSTRQPRDAVQRATFWVGMAVAVIAIVGGWFYTVGHSVQSNITGTNDKLRELSSDLDTFMEAAETNPVVNPPKLPGPTTAAAAAQFEDILRDVLAEDASTTTQRNDLLAPGAPSSTTEAESVEAVTGTHVSEPTFPIDPYSPGLMPDVGAMME